jgi:ketosteroid isomerase-like protein
MKSSTLLHCLNGLRQFAIAFLFIMCVVTTVAAGKNSREAAVLKFAQDWADTWVKADYAAMQRIVEDDFVAISPAGKVNDKAQHIEEFKSGRLKVQSLVLSNMRGRFYGDVAVVTGNADSKANFDGQDISGKYSFTDVFVRRRGEWKAVSTQATKVVP